MADGAILADDAAARLFDRMPADLAGGLTPDQRSAIAAILSGRATDRPPVNLRVSVPLLGWRFFFAVIAGRERRSVERRGVERVRHPLHTAGNFMFVLAGAMAFYVVALIGFLVWSSVVEF